jgi:hypothetical protein
MKCQVVNAYSGQAIYFRAGAKVGTRLRLKKRTDSLTVVISTLLLNFELTFDPKTFKLEYNSRSRVWNLTSCATGLQLHISKVREKFHKLLSNPNLWQTLSM